VGGLCLVNEKALQCGRQASSHAYSLPRALAVIMLGAWLACHGSIAFQLVVSCQHTRPQTEAALPHMLCPVLACPVGNCHMLRPSPVPLLNNPPRSGTMTISASRRCSMSDIGMDNCWAATSATSRA
jgi:hypothetical protein